MSPEQEQLVIYEQKQQIQDELMSRYFSVGTTLPIKPPELVLTSQALSELEAAENETRTAYAAFIKACQTSLYY